MTFSGGSISLCFFCRVSTKPPHALPSGCWRPGSCRHGRGSGMWEQGSFPPGFNSGCALSITEWGHCSIQTNQQNVGVQSGEDSPSAAASAGRSIQRVHLPRRQASSRPGDSPCMQAGCWGVGGWGGPGGSSRARGADAGPPVAPREAWLPWWVSPATFPLLPFSPKWKCFD